MSDFDPTTLATQLASYDILALQNSIQTQTSTLAAQKKALTSLRTALTDFRTAIKGLNSSSSNVLKNSVTMNQEGIATISASASARKGTYSLNVTQLASAQQKGFSDLTDEDIKNATGTLTINLNGESIDIEMDNLNSLSDFAGAVNKADFPSASGNTSATEQNGVTASLMRVDGKVQLMLSSDQSGEQYDIQLDTSAMTGDQTIFDNATIITSGKDAKFTLGDSPQEYSSSSNNLDNLVDGVSIKLTGTTEVGKPLVISVDTDPTGTQEQIQAFIDAYNTLKDTISGLTSSGSNTDERGAFAGDASISSLSNELSNILRQTFGDENMTKFGITSDKDGKLSLDADTLEEQLKADPQSVNNFFNGNDGMIKAMDKSLDKYLNTSTGLLKGRQDTLDRQQRDIDTKTEKMNTRYESSYNRYLKQFTQLQSIMTQMNNTMSMFS
ncbi:MULTISPECIES: flagellar filament capping protein FliD [Citrobacter]|uniref:flagellar filament capping protein FliD n=1 Tax=Citrobacter TaxID=544 RepID=UPI0007422F7D|nr:MULTISPECIES: flagellar filament capping protein FliD [Citrobacter]KSY25903.1 flagellar hook-associated protein [Citrobacter sp. 50677481]MEB0950526.1 flagellar filament capping protein FliD [Citrobacter sedlakii]HCQ7756862.1 flagellar filament capping protein FliD [Citrobacter sedlakii]